MSIPSSPKRARTTDSVDDTARPTKKPRTEPLNARSQALLDLVTAKYVLAMKLADKFYDHVYELFNHEAMYWETNSCFVKLENPRVFFDWSNVGEHDDDFVVDANDKNFQAFFDARLMKKSDRDKAHEVLTHCFLALPTADLVIENWSNDCYSARGGRMGASTGGNWVEAEPNSSDVESGDE